MGILANANIESNGTISGNQSAFDLGYAKIEQGVTYTCNGLVTGFYTSIPTVGAVSYDGQRYVSSTDITTFTAPISGYCAFRKEHNGEFMLNTGSTALPYEPYWPPSLKKYDGSAWQNATVHDF